MPINFLDDNHFELNGLTFEYGFSMEHSMSPSSSHAAFVMKHRTQIERYEKFLGGREFRNVVELGIFYGGSAIFLDRLLHPHRLVALDIRAEPASALTHYRETFDRSDAVHAYYGVDQSDKARLTSILDEVFGDESIDLVIDDASHAYGATVASFEAIFPRLRSGALYIVEDWDFMHLLAAAMEKVLQDPSHPRHEAAKEALIAGMRRKTPMQPELGRFAMEAALMTAGTSDLVREVRVRANWIIIERGSGHIDFATARLDKLAPDRFQVLRPLADTPDLDAPNVLSALFFGMR